MPINGHTPGQERLQDRLRSAQEECERLREENARLRAMLGIPALVRDVTTSNSVPTPEDSTKATGSPSTPEEKIAHLEEIRAGLMSKSIAIERKIEEVERRRSRAVMEESIVGRERR